MVRDYLEILTVQELAIVFAWVVVFIPFVSRTSNERVRLAGRAANEDPVFFIAYRFRERTVNCLFVIGVSQFRADRFGICGLKFIGVSIV